MSKEKFEVQCAIDELYYYFLSKANEKEKSKKVNEIFAYLRGLNFHDQL